MEVRCSNCATEYEFDDALVASRGTSVKCTNCGHQFSVRPPPNASSPDLWVVRQANGEALSFTTLTALHRAIKAGKVLPDDLLVRGSMPPRPLRAIYELAQFFPKPIAREPARPLPPPRRRNRMGSTDKLTPPPAPAERKPPRIFLSYCHDSKDHQARVLDLARTLQTQGMDVRLDQFVSAPAKGWPRWCQSELERADFVLMICTPEYCARFEGRGTGGANWEGFLTMQMLYEDGTRNLRFIPVVFGDEPSSSIPMVVRGTTRYSLPTGHDALFARLRHQPPAQRSPHGPSDRPRQPPDPELDPELSQLRAEKRAIAMAGGDLADVDHRILFRRRQIRDRDDVGRGTRLAEGRYELGDPIKSGGFGTVWKAWDYELQRVVAIKILHGQYFEDKERQARFFRGARLMAALDHPAIVRVVQSKGQEGSSYYFVMEYLSGGDLAHAVETREVGPAHAKVVLREIGKALAHAHEAGIIHRDVKPANVLRGSERVLKLTDFDLVHAIDTTGGTRTGAMGTFFFAAPELLTRANRVDARVDVYALGMMGQFIVNGGPLPLEAITDQSTFRDGLDWPAGLRDVVARACDPRPEARFQSMLEMCRALE